MSSAKILLDKWMQACSIPNLDAAAKRLGKAKGTTVSNWRTGYAKPDDASIALMCEQCGEDAALWVARLHAEFESDQRMKRVWLRLAQVAAALALTLGVTAPYSSAHAERASFSRNQGHPVYYVKLHLYVGTALCRAKASFEGRPGYIQKPALWLAID
ncbi:hypothetical protein KK141_11045 [Dyella sp. LX-66]|uniref:hypothetical protein n=1 Tax=unclassified Dyella TaxID=2634549 RepID=UPI001BDFC039|nr:MULTISPECIES: hypothetical protein [unclassified Dyella]MBT2118939.1 hypothetical protein [Dyella sp. LX-1]MBT2140067.1 hypothetical protein [Dyella sp. LX-66]